jgi:hypothetical protein
LILIDFQDEKIVKVDLSQKRVIILTLKDGIEISLFIDEIEEINNLIKIDNPTTKRRY